MGNTLNPVAKKQIVWLDVVRLLAMFTVVCCHSTDPFNFYPGEPPANISEIKFWGAAYGSVLRPCVPLFVMITGALLLPVKGDTGAFYRKRISRVFWPFLIWSVIYNLFPWITGLLGCRPELILDFFPYSGEEAARQSLSVSMDYISHIPLNFSLLDVHMWYIYLLIGMYLYMPVFSAWVEKASEKAKLWFLAAWGVTLFVPYYREFVNPYLWGSCSWNEFYMLYNFAGFNGYLLLGHYLRHHDFSLARTLGWGIPSFVIGFLITFLGFRHITSLPEYTEEQLEALREQLKNGGLTEEEIQDIINSLKNSSGDVDIEKALSDSVAAKQMKLAQAEAQLTSLKTQRAVYEAQTDETVSDIYKSVMEQKQKDYLPLKTAIHIQQQHCH